MFVCVLFRHLPEQSFPANFPTQSLQMKSFFSGKNAHFPPFLQGFGSQRLDLVTNKKKEKYVTNLDIPKKARNIFMAPDTRNF